MKTFEIGVRLALMNEFREKAIFEGCKVVNVIELIRNAVILFILEIPDGKEELITDFAFMTFIKNPKFQKYYELTDKVLDQINKDEKQYEFEHRKGIPIAINPDMNPTDFGYDQIQYLPASISLKDQKFRTQAFDFINKKPIGIFDWLPENKGTYNKESNLYFFEPSEGTTWRWPYEKITIINQATPTFLNKKKGVWFYGSDEIQVSF